MGCAAGWSHILTAGLIWVAFSIDLPEWGRTFSRGVSKQGFENEKIRDYEVVNVLPKVTVMGSMIGHRMFWWVGVIKKDSDTHSAKIDPGTFNVAGVLL